TFTHAPPPSPPLRVTRKPLPPRPGWRGKARRGLQLTAGGLGTPSENGWIWRVRGEAPLRLCGVLVKLGKAVSVAVKVEAHGAHQRHITAQRAAVVSVDLQAAGGFKFCYAGAEF